MNFYLILMGLGSLTIKAHMLTCSISLTNIIMREDSERDMKQQIALVTGSNRGIGFEIAKQLAMKKIEVILTSRNSDNGEAAVRKLARDGVKKVVAMELDVTNQVSADNLLDKVEKTFGRLDILVNNAAILIDREEVAASNADLESVKATLETNLIGAWRMCKAFVPLMKKNGYGRIVNVSSGSGEFGYMATSGGSWPAYSVSKASLNALTVMLASELKGTNILVNAVCPGWVRTDMGGSNATRSVEEGADTPVWLATLADGGPTGHNYYDKKQISW
jgi:NAD(P)-dependent dehydrogenase (short-subunit alcohol dehydrogenase family)